jgi:hypothetical protein
VVSARSIFAAVAIGDFQYFITAEGRAVIIDPGGARNYTDHMFPTYERSMQNEVARVRANWNKP